MRNPYLFLFFCALLLIFTQCKSKSQYREVKTKRINSNLEYTVSSINIHLPDSTEFDQYFAIQNDTNLLLVYFNYHSETIDYFDINNDNIIKRNYINKSDLPFDETINAASIYQTSPDSLYVLTESYLLILDKTGKIYYSNPININLTDTTFKKNLFENLSKMFPIYRFANKTYMPYRSLQYSFRTKEFYNHPVEAFIDDSSGIISESTLKYPEIYYKNPYGFMDFSFREGHDSLGILSFMADPNIYVYNYKTNSYKILGGKSDYQEKIEPIENKFKDVTNKMFEFLTTSPFYSRILWDKYRKLYYRFLYCGQDLKNPNGTYNVFADKDLVLMIFDSNFNLLKEIKLKKHTYLDTKAFVAKDGLFLPKKNIFFKDNKPNTINYDIYNFK